MIKKKTLFLGLSMLGLSCLGLGDAFAQVSDGAVTVSDTSSNDLLNLSLEDLMNMKVTVSSKKAEKISDAPGSITAYSDKDILKLGYYTLGDLANITSGYSAFKGIGETTFETRGQKQDGFDNNKHLILIDGIPFSHARANRASAEEDLPLFFAKRVEFLKGPGSALYGTSAFSGVINIVTKDLEENGSRIESKVSIGSLDFKKRAMVNAIFKSDAGLSKLNVGYFAKDPTRDFLGTGLNNNYQSRYFDNQTSFFLNFSHKITTGVLNGLGAGLIYSKKSGGLGEFWMGQQTQNFEFNELTLEEIVPYLKYERTLSEKFTFNSYIKGNMSTERAYVGGWMNQFSSGGGTGFSMYNIRVYDKELLAELRYKMFENTNLIGGVNVISRYSTGAPNTYAYAITGGPGSTINLDPSLSYTSRSSNYNIYSAYIQAQQNIDFLKGLIITAGGRMDMGRVYAASNGDVISSYNQFSPRVALVQKITEQLNAKLMFGMALRAPLIKEVGLIEEARANPANAAVLNNIPTSVKAENIKTFEGALTYNNNKISVTTTYFNNRTNDPLGKKSVAGVQGEVTANTNGYTKASGFELETSIAPIKQIRLGANYSYAFAEVFTVQRNAKNTADTTVVSRVANVPTVKINGYLTYSIEAPVKVSATLVGRWIENYRIGGVTTARLAGFKVFDLNLVGAVTENVSLEFQVRNLLDAEVRTPAFHNSGLLNLPFPGRSFLGTIAFKF